MNPNLVIIGPEIPLANGLADFLRKKDFKVFGPNKDGAKLEFSKSWAKEFMQGANIPTANFWKVNIIHLIKILFNISKNFLPKKERDILDIKFY